MANSLYLGEVHGTIGTKLDNGDTRLNVTTCIQQNLCGVPASPWGFAAVPVLLYPCSVTGATGWNGQI